MIGSCLCALLAHMSIIIFSSAQATHDLKLDPCRPFEPRNINFSAPGRKINQVKCYEYILNFKNREDESNQRKECALKRQKEGITFSSDNLDYIHGEFPHMGALGWKANKNETDADWLFYCGGSLISPNFVLTAAHCHKSKPHDTKVEDRDPKIVRLGTTDISRKKRIRRVIATYPDPVDAKILRVILHPNYSPPKKFYDIALLEIENNVKFTMLIQPACLWNDDDVSSIQTKTVVSGWGYTDTVTHTQANELQITSLDLVDSTICGNLLMSYISKRWGGLKDHQICAGGKQGIDTCQGDSGGPLETKINLPLKNSAMYYIVGITSFGIGCGLKDTPGVYTRVSSFVEWIENTVWPTK